MDVLAGSVVVRKIITGSQRIFIGRAKTIIVAETFQCIENIEVCISRKIDAGFLGSDNSRTKVIMGVVMVYNSRKVVVGYADICSGCSEGHYGLIKKKSSHYWEDFCFHEETFL